MWHLRVTNPALAASRICACVSLNPDLYRLVFDGDLHLRRRVELLRAPHGDQRAAVLRAVHRARLRPRALRDVLAAHRAGNHADREALVDALLDLRPGRVIDDLGAQDRGAGLPPVHAAEVRGRGAGGFVRVVHLADRAEAQRGWGRSEGNITYLVVTPIRSQ